MDRCFASLLVAASLGLAGCGSNDHGLVPVTGVVLLDGKPVGNAAVMFHHPAGQTAYAIADDDGSFSMTTREPGDGVAAGEHRVTVSLSIQEGGVQADAHGLEDYSKPISPVRHIDVVPKAYNDPSTTPLSVHVAKRMSGLRLELQSKPR